MYTKFYYLTISDRIWSKNFLFRSLFVDNFKVLYDFEKCQSDINPNALIEAWPRVSEKLHSAMNTSYTTKTFSTPWPEEVESFLIFIRLLPFKAKKSSTESAETFTNAIKRFIVFAKVLNGMIFLFLSDMRSLEL